MYFIRIYTERALYGVYTSFLASFRPIKITKLKLISNSDNFRKVAECVRVCIPVLFSLCLVSISIQFDGKREANERWMMESNKRRRRKRMRKRRKRKKRTRECQIMTK